MHGDDHEVLTIFSLTMFSISVARSVVVPSAVFRATLDDCWGTGPVSWYQLMHKVSTSINQCNTYQLSKMKY